ncbi:hypothetical protein ACFP9V_19275 [Deinococcus radiopugnans]|uniref:HAD superfamily protein n=1 Tax=Deinococcus radiopugnans ATCC 19172 TaxID=585398 RepID=A0A5C4YA55_9DEIO|nr:hypothetical protein [Deinococcus radiopugnans]MBB6016770.1 putative HAD superfamily protein [Deinococcus radiopugnans ATCC 19172]TNM71936.1 hypothetical protein FHR04_06100 [Deinococcus radiopugnans ATCC 19172]
MTAPTSEESARLAYERAVQKRDAAQYVMTRVPLELASEAHQQYMARAEAAHAAFLAWMGLRAAA